MQQSYLKHMGVPMRVIIAGSRGMVDPVMVNLAIEDSGFTLTEVVSGTARGADKMGEVWAEQMGIPIRRFPADWNLHRKSAGFVRNIEMAIYADALVAIWDGASRGTAHMIKAAETHGLQVYVHRYTE
jgi:hypothetical protein